MSDIRNFDAILQYVFTEWRAVICPNSYQIDKTNKALLHLQARCVGDRIQLQEAKSNPETHFINGQVSSIRGRYILGFEWKDYSVFYFFREIENSAFIQFYYKSKSILS